MGTNLYGATDSDDNSVLSRCEMSVAELAEHYTAAELLFAVDLRKSIDRAKEREEWMEFIGERIAAIDTLLSGVGPFLQRHLRYTDGSFMCEDDRPVNFGTCIRCQLIVYRQALEQSEPGQMPGRLSAEYVPEACSP